MTPAEAVAEYADLAHRIARKHYRRSSFVSRALDAEDLAQDGLARLVKFAHKIDPTRGPAFAAMHISGGIVDALRSAGFAPRKIKAEDRALYQLFSERSDGEWFDTLIEGRERHGISAEDREEIEAAMAWLGLSNRDRYVVRLRLEGLTMREIGRASGYSESMMSITLSRILPNLTQALADRRAA